VLIYAHRGSSHTHPENTLSAFDAAISEGADGIETDLRLTLDRRIVLAHDDTLRGPDGEPMRISDATLSELRRHSGTGAGAFATLDQLLDLTLGRVLLNLEIKDPAVTPHLGKYLRGGEDLLITSFNEGAVLEAKALYPNIEAGLVTNRWDNQAESFAKTHKLDAVSLKKRAFTAEALTACASLGARLLLWVVNDPSEAEEFRDMGLDGVFSDNPGILVDALGAKDRRG